jgi:hypothetical protein
MAFTLKNPNQEAGHQFSFALFWQGSRGTWAAWQNATFEGERPMVQTDQLY